MDDTLNINDNNTIDDTPYYDDNNDAVHTPDDEYEPEEYEPVPKYDQALIDDIFGISDDEDDYDENVVTPDTSPIITDVNENIHDLPADDMPVLRRSGRNHVPGRWNKRYVGTMFYNHTHIYKMTVSEGIDKLGVVLLQLCFRTSALFAIVG